MYCSCIFNRIAIDQLSRDSPLCTSAAALSAAVDSINKPSRNLAPTLRRNRLRRSTSNSNASRSSGEGVWGRGASHREAASPPEFPTSSYAARPRRLCQPPWTQSSLSKIRLTSGGTKLEATNPAKRQSLFGREREGGASLREAASLAYPHFRSALRERGSGGEALLTEKRPLPQSSPRPSRLCRNFFACVE